MAAINQNNSSIEERIIRVAPVELGIGSRNILKDFVMSMLPKGGDLNFCFNCGACSSGCPASCLAGMDPRKFVRMVSLGMDEEIMACDWVWICTTCERCVHVCPMKVDIPLLVSIIRSQWPKGKRPRGIVDDCERSLKTDTCSTAGISVADWKFIVEDIVDDVRQTQQGFEELKVPMDEKYARLFLTQNSSMPLTEPLEMPPLWKILSLAGADWTYGSKGWAAENFGYLLADDAAWEKILRKKAEVVEQLGCKVLVNTECGHDFLATRQGLEKFKIDHSFEVKSIIEYYADWIRNGRLKVNSDWNSDKKIKFTIQDPCQLVRKSYGDFIADELRFVVKEAVGEENFIDMYPNRSNNYCCGGGGGAILTDFKEERLSYGKIKLDQILETEADYCITPCNNCHSQIMDLSHYYDARFKTIHLWTILCLSMGVLGENERKYLGDDLAMVGLK
ncbi:MAG: (Fe-S)-binding protein [Desulfobacula sp.]|jgi:Fe-S oxidoreductase|nr:(Fe-S)-binding protein [Desulfobacula sp.]MBT3486033.1 (Fe-S)-binding protein [Desulfobacula sp.]MBT3804970.1 (Fe-S)-binding protein [Desulfobacula sp.]MBT4025458.1 (Fe-S)-binding protein [Desulfobacula sp.]MBT4198728.1 (Fe-S)-binding protein [Desulfobacula sp.]